MESSAAPEEPTEERLNQTIIEILEDPELRKVVERALASGSEERLAFEARRALRRKAHPGRSIFSPTTATHARSLSSLDMTVGKTYLVSATVGNAGIAFVATLLSVNEKKTDQSGLEAVRVTQWSNGVSLSDDGSLRLHDMTPGY